MKCVVLAWRVRAVLFELLDHITVRLQLSTSEEFFFCSDQLIGLQRCVMVEMFADVHYTK